MSDIVERLRDNLRGREPYNSLMAEAANHIESLMELSWDHFMAILDDFYPQEIFDGSSGDEGPRTLVLIREIERLRSLITAWADAEAADGFHNEPECNCGAPLCTASTALRKAVGR